MKETYLLKTKGAQQLYLEHAKGLPIIDFHNHVSVADIASDRRFENLYELWLASDPYKHRLMRICGVDEHFITGEASSYEKIEKYCLSKKVNYLGIVICLYSGIRIGELLALTYDDIDFEKNLW